MFDEPSSFLDVKQRLKAAQVIRSLLKPDKLVSSSLYSLVLYQKYMTISFHILEKGD